MTSDFPPPGSPVLQVRELTAALKELLETAVPSVWVEGEVSNLARPQSGHVYLTLKDAEASLRVVVYRGVALRLKYDLADGLHVIAQGRLSVYAPRGEYQLLVEQVQPRGVGPLELAFRQRKERLFAKGYFDPGRKRPLPRYPRRIGLVTSATGSAVRDVLEVLARRWPAVEVWVHPSRVQGDEAAPEIAAAVGYLNQVGRKGGPSPIDVLVLARGGGSLEDLWPFNEEVVAHAIFRSAIPVVTGIGHEDDLTLADLVADQRALTPSEAAERVVPDRAAVLADLDATTTRLRTLLGRRLMYTQARLEQLERRPCLTRPLDIVDRHRRQIDDLAGRLRRAIDRHGERSRSRLAAAAALLDGLSPLKVLGRGYSVTRKLDTLSLVRSPAEVAPGDWIVSEIHRGRIVSRVESATECDPDTRTVRDEPNPRP
jgi:exodeoxyribonuclease VII large subunit